LVSGCIREGKRKEGEALVDEMLDKEFIPDLATYNRFIDGLSKTRSSAQ
jgi:pentatricopeptide repeat protein